MKRIDLDFVRLDSVSGSAPRMSVWTKGKCAMSRKFSIARRPETWMRVAPALTTRRTGSRNSGMSKIGFGVAANESQIAPYFSSADIAKRLPPSSNRPARAIDE